MDSTKRNGSEPARSSTLVIQIDRSDGESVAVQMQVEPVYAEVDREERVRAIGGMLDTAFRWAAYDPAIYLDSRVGLREREDAE